MEHKRSSISQNYNLKPNCKWIPNGRAEKIPSVLSTQAIKLQELIAQNPSWNFSFTQIEGQKPPAWKPPILNNPLVFQLVLHSAR